MNANSTPGQVGTTQLTTLPLFDDLRDRKSLDLREVGRGGGDRNYLYQYSQGLTKLSTEQKETT
jgi:hypothetical protein